VAKFNETIKVMDEQQAQLAGRTAEFLGSIALSNEKIEVVGQKILTRGRN
jgi:hypothetical protein